MTQGWWDDAGDIDALVRAAAFAFLSEQTALHGDVLSWRPTADSAVRKRGLIVISQWNPKKRRLDEVAVLPADEVRRAEVQRRGAPVEIVVGTAGDSA
jgi:hypothetical protein